MEVLLRSALVQDLIREGKIPELRELMKRSRETGMQTFDQSLFDLYEAGKIGEDEALRLLLVGQCELGILGELDLAFDQHRLAGAAVSRLAAEGPRPGALAPAPGGAAHGRRRVNHRAATNRALEAHNTSLTATSRVCNCVHLSKSLLCYTGIYLGCSYRCMTQQFLHNTNVRPALQ